MLWTAPTRRHLDAVYWETLTVCLWHKGLVVGLYGSFRYGPNFEHRQTGLAPCGYDRHRAVMTMVMAR